MIFEFNFEPFTSVDEQPRCTIFLNHSSIYTGVVEEHIKAIATFVDDYSEDEYVLKVYAYNISEDKKVNGEFGFKIKSVKINGVDLEFFNYSATTYNPGIDNPFNSGKRADYVNMKDGWWKLKFRTPLWKFLLDKTM